MVIYDQPNMKTSHFLLLLFCLCICIKTCLADSSPLQDICPAAARDTEKPIFINGLLCKNPATITASDFKTSELNQAGDTDNFLRSAAKITTAADFPGLNTQGLSIARTDLAVDGLVVPHAHPRASELFYVSKGVVVAGFIDTGGRLYQQNLREGDVFLFPRGLLHFSLNAGYELATAFSFLNGQNPGVVSIMDAMFGSDSVMLDKLVRRMRSLSDLEIGHIRNVTMALERS